MSRTTRGMIQETTPEAQSILDVIKNAFPPPTPPIAKHGKTRPLAKPTGPMGLERLRDKYSRAATPTDPEGMKALGIKPEDFDATILKTIQARKDLDIHGTQKEIEEIVDKELQSMIGSPPTKPGAPEIAKADTPDAVRPLMPDAVRPLMPDAVRPLMPDAVRPLVAKPVQEEERWSIRQK